MIVGRMRCGRIEGRHQGDRVQLMMPLRLSLRGRKALCRADESSAPTLVQSLPPSSPSPFSRLDEQATAVAGRSWSSSLVSSSHL